ncbi:protein bcp1 [Elsinoe ampelina]|uniref:Protein BCP1 n=1 Tax=Elsinoe ampelina TaxID=302913 RepID=A0A6A6GHV5_9PEZI|nr:protein bcp1 [Elsinoe ampelina]
MAKRKAHEPNGKVPPANSDSGSDEDLDTLDVDFEWFDPSPIDFHGLKSLLRQLLDADATLFDLSSLADLILSQPHLGSTVKCDGQDSDPYAFLTVLSLRTHAANPALQTLTAYLQSRSRTNPSLAPLSTLLSNPDAHVGLILSEKLINMPTEIVPPMYTMLLEELIWAAEEKRPVDFTHYVVLSKTYSEVASELDEPARPQKKVRQGGGGGEGEVFFFHAEDEVLARHAVCAGGWDFEKVSEGGADARRAFQESGIKPQGHVTVIEKGRFEGAVKAVGEYLGVKQ